MFFFSVKQASSALGVSTQRIRALLGMGRLYGFKDKNDCWLVGWPVVFRSGRRGPSGRIKGASQ